MTERAVSWLDINLESIHLLLKHICHYKIFFFHVNYRKTKTKLANNKPVYLLDTPETTECCLGRGIKYQVGNVAQSRIQ